MLEKLIRRHDRLVHHLSAPLLEEREQFLSSLIDQGTSAAEVRILAGQLLNVIRLLKLHDKRMVTRSEVEEAAQRWLVDQEAARWQATTQNSAKKFRRAAFKWLRFHDQILPEVSATRPHFETLSRYIDSINHRLSKDTARNYSRIARNLLQVAACEYPSLASLSTDDIYRYLDIHIKSGKSPGTIAAHCQAIRTFLHFCEATGQVTSGLADKICSPRVRRYDPNPRGPKWRDVCKLLRLGGQNNISDIRARAIVALCAIYAMRAREVSELKLGDFDWNGELLTIRRAKGGPVQRFPLQFEVGEAILKYLLHARPKCASRRLFVTLNPPYRAILTHTIQVIVRSRMERLEIKAISYGPHSLRHACATRLLEKGAAVREIADFLGHRTVESVSVYAKCSPKALREVAEFPLGILP